MWKVQQGKNFWILRDIYFFNVSDDHAGIAVCTVDAYKYRWGNLLIRDL